jgi:hypothetical protein
MRKKFKTLCAIEGGPTSKPFNTLGR